MNLRGEKVMLDADSLNCELVVERALRAAHVGRSPQRDFLLAAAQQSLGARGAHRERGKKRRDYSDFYRTPSGVELIRGITPFRRAPFLPAEEYLHRV